MKFSGSNIPRIYSRALQAGAEVVEAIAFGGTNGKHAVRGIDSQRQIPTTPARALQR